MLTKEKVLEMVKKKGVMPQESQFKDNKKYKKKIKEIERKSERLALVSNAYDWMFDNYILDKNHEGKRYCQLCEELLNEEGKKIRIELKINIVVD